MLDAPVKAGDVLVNKYRVSRVLGVGGMGVVVAATHMQLGHQVALKFMLQTVAGSKDAKERFLREARAAARLKSEHIAKVSDVGTLENGAPYIVMEYLEGQDLATHLKLGGPLPIEEAVLYAMQTCAAMAEAHANGIVHRDLKPENLFLARRLDGSPMIKVLDFGVSKLSEFTGGISTTKTGTAMGTPAYMAPEQMRSAKDVDERADIWSMGAILFQLLSGRLPFEADTIPEMFAKVLTSPPSDLLASTPGIPPALNDIIGRCLQKETDRRPASVIELALLLGPFGGQSGWATANSVRSMFPQEAAAIASMTPHAHAANTVPGHRAGQHEAATVPGQVDGPTGTTLGQSIGGGYSTASTAAVANKRPWPALALLGLFAIVAIGIGVATQDSSPSSPAPAAASGGVEEPVATDAEKHEADEATRLAEEATRAEAQRVSELEESLARERKAREEAEARTGVMEDEKLAADAKRKAAAAKREEADAKREEADAKREEADARREEARAKREEARKAAAAKRNETNEKSHKKKRDESDPFDSID